MRTPQSRLSRSQLKPAESVTDRALPERFVRLPASRHERRNIVQINTQQSAAHMAADEVRRSRAKSFLALDEKERYDANFLASGASRHISELPAKLVEILAKHHARIQDLFKTLDVDGNGQIQRDEFIGTMVALGLADAYTAEEMGILFAAVDRDDSKTISFEEMADMCQAARRGHDVLAQEDKQQRRAREEAALAQRAAEAAEVARSKAQARAAAEAAALHAAAAETRETSLQKDRADHEMQAELDKLRKQIEAGGISDANVLRLEAEGRKLRLLEAFGRLPPNQVAALKASHRAPPRREWNRYPQPRVERSSKKQDMAYRAKPDMRPASVAWPTATEIPVTDSEQLARFSPRLWSSSSAAALTQAKGASGALSQSQSATTISGSAVNVRLSRPASAAALSYVSTPGSNAPTRSLTINAMRPAPSIPPAMSLVAQTQQAYGAKRLLLRVHRPAPHHYIFFPMTATPKPALDKGQARIDMGRGGIRDDDIVSLVIQKLHDAYPREVPLEVSWGVGSRTTSMRPVRHVLVTARSTVLVEAQPIGAQYLRGNFAPSWKYNRNPEHHQGAVRRPVSAPSHTRSPIVPLLNFHGIRIQQR